MTAILCAGDAAQAIGEGCRSVTGADAVYFGADQPRITAEMLLPWPAIGIAAAKFGTNLRVEAAVTAWHRDRLDVAVRPRAREGDGRPIGLAPDAARRRSDDGTAERPARAEAPNRIWLRPARDP
jgi:hypothetical protein